MKPVSVLVSLALAASLLAGYRSISADTDAPVAYPPVAYPDGYREWAHVKSSIMTPQHTNFEQLGGFRHIYANAEAMKGYRSGTFPEGSILVFDWLQLRENAAVYEEGPRRQVDVMVKDSKRFASTGGWGFERFAGDSRTERAAQPPREACFACHDKLKKHDLVLSSLRP